MLLTRCWCGTTERQKPALSGRHSRVWYKFATFTVSRVPIADKSRRLIITAACIYTAAADTCKSYCRAHRRDCDVRDSAQDLKQDASGLKFEVDGNRENVMDYNVPENGCMLCKYVFRYLIYSYMQLIAMTVGYLILSFTFSALVRQ